jgi:hypothetical protein
VNTPWSPVAVSNIIKRSEAAVTTLNVFVAGVVALYAAGSCHAARRPGRQLCRFNARCFGLLRLCHAHRKYPRNPQE